MRSDLTTAAAVVVLFATAAAPAADAPPLFEGLGSHSRKVMTTSLDAISEVKVLRDNYAAEYGNNGGAMINIVTKGGGKAYRGTAYYFIRNEALNANNFFSNKAGLKRPL